MLVTLSFVIVYPQITTLISIVKNYGRSINETLPDNILRNVFNDLKVQATDCRINEFLDYAIIFYDSVSEAAKCRRFYA